MSEKPTSPSDPRPNDEPYYIDSECPNCGSELMLYDELTEEQLRNNKEFAPPENQPDEGVWYDEWVCPECLDGVHMDWPDEYKDEIFGRVDQNT